MSWKQIPCLQNIRTRTSIQPWGGERRGHITATTHEALIVSNAADTTDVRWDRTWYRMCWPLHHQGWKKLKLPKNIEWKDSATSVGRSGLRLTDIAVHLRTRSVDECRQSQVRSRRFYWHVISMLMTDPRSGSSFQDSCIPCFSLFWCSTPSSPLQCPCSLWTLRFHETIDKRRNQCICSGFSGAWWCYHEIFHYFVIHKPHIIVLGNNPCKCYTLEVAMKNHHKQVVNVMAGSLNIAFLHQALPHS